MCLLHLLPPTTGGFRILLVVHVLACVCFLIGWQFRISEVVVFVTLVSIHQLTESATLQPRVIDPLSTHA